MDRADEAGGGRGTTIASHVFINFIELNRSPGPGNSPGNMLRPKTYKTAPCLQAGRQLGKGEEWRRLAGSQPGEGEPLWRLAPI